MHKSKLDFFPFSCDFINESLLFILFFLSFRFFSLVNGGSNTYWIVLDSLLHSIFPNFIRSRYFFSRSVCVSVFDINLFERESERVSERMSDPKENNDWNQFSRWVFLRTTILLETTFASDIRFWLLLSFALFFRPFIRELINVRLQVLLFWHPVRLLLCHYCRLFIHL